MTKKPCQYILVNSLRKGCIGLTVGVIDDPFIFQQPYDVLDDFVNAYQRLSSRPEDEIGKPDGGLVHLGEVLHPATLGALVLVGRVEIRSPWCLGIWKLLVVALLWHRSM